MVWLFGPPLPPTTSPLLLPPRVPPSVDLRTAIIAIANDANATGLNGEIATARRNDSRART